MKIVQNIYLGTPFICIAFPTQNRPNIFIVVSDDHALKFLEDENSAELTLSSVDQIL